MHVRRSCEQVWRMAWLTVKIGPNLCRTSCVDKTSQVQTFNLSNESMGMRGIDAVASFSITHACWLKVLRMPGRLTIPVSLFGQKTKRSPHNSCQEWSSNTHDTGSGERSDLRRSIACSTELQQWASSWQGVQDHRILECHPSSTLGCSSMVSLCSARGGVEELGRWVSTWCGNRSTEQRERNQQQYRVRGAG